MAAKEKPGPAPVEVLSKPEGRGGLQQGITRYLEVKLEGIERGGIAYDSWKRCHRIWKKSSGKFTPDLSQCGRFGEALAANLIAAQPGMGVIPIRLADEGAYLGDFFVVSKRAGSLDFYLLECKYHPPSLPHHLNWQFDSYPLQLTQEIKYIREFYLKPLINLIWKTYLETGSQPSPEFNFKAALATLRGTEINYQHRTGRFYFGKPPHFADLVRVNPESLWVQAITATGSHLERMITEYEQWQQNKSVVG